MKRIKIALVTGCRSDFGLVAPLINALLNFREVQPLLYVTGNHTSPVFGSTIETVANRFPIAGIWDAFPGGFSSQSIASGLGLLQILATSDLSREIPNALVVAGDRTEMLPPSLSAAIMGIPVAHVGGGETTLGAVDERMRNCLTSLATWHFVGIPDFRVKVINKGADPRNVYVTGETALDTLLVQPDLSESELAEKFGFIPDRKTVLAAYHPETLAADLGIHGLENLLTVLERIDHRVIFTYPNSDVGSLKIIEKLKIFAAKKKCILLPSLGSRNWVALLRRVGVLLGNSSSGILEAPSFSLPAVNIGNRQAGRFKSANVIDAAPTVNGINDALLKALSDEFRDSLKGLVNPYGDGRSAERIASILIGEIKSGGASGK